MDVESLKNLINRIPFIPLFIGIIAYLCFDAYVFTYGKILSYEPGSDYISKQKQIEAKKLENIHIKEKIEKAVEFWKTLESKKKELQNLAKDLDGMKATLSEHLDVPEFMKLILTEAKKVGLTVLGLKPISQNKKEYYTENSFELGFRGAYVQLLVFLDRLSESQRVIRVDNFLIKPKGNPQARFVELEGTIQVKGYYYLGSKLDEVKKPPLKSGGEI